MGNQRQMLKEKIEKELVLRIQEAKEFLNLINKNLETNKQNSFNAKEEIRVTADLIKEVLIQRKKDMIKQVESLHHAQEKPLKDAMKSTYITLGSLQSTLTNLETFDQGQLVNLQIPQIDRLGVTKEPAQIMVSLECEKLKEDLSVWGDVSVDELNCLMSDGYDLVPGHKPTDQVSKRGSMDSIRSSSSENVRAMYLKNATQKNDKLTVTAKENECWWNTGGIEKWLSGSSSKRMSVDDNDMNDFFMVSQFPYDDENTASEPVGEPLREQLRTQFPLGELKSIPRDDGESSSSIVCLEKHPESESHEDLSIWLKTRKSKVSPQIKNQDVSQSVPVLSDVKNLKTRCSKNSTNARLLEFPCLQMDSDSWIRKKKPRPSTCCIQSRTSSLKKQDLIPPAYDLPNPFWLKKYR